MFLKKRSGKMTTVAVKENTLKQLKKLKKRLNKNSLDEVIQYLLKHLNEVVP